MDLRPTSGDDEDESTAMVGGSYNIGGLAMELRDRLLLLLTRVWASEKAVSQRGGTSEKATGAGLSITGSSLLSCDDIRPSVADCLPFEASVCFPFRTDACRRTEGFLMFRDGVVSAPEAGSPG